MTAEKQDANLVGFYKIREATLGQTPATGAWQTREPNSFDNFGAEYKKTPRKPFSPTRQRKKGSTTDLDATSGFNEDVTQNNMQTEFEEFFFANLHATHEETSLVAVASTDDFTVAASSAFLSRSLIHVTGFTNTANNGLHVVNGLTDATHISTASSLVDETAAGAKVKIVGYQFPAGDVSIAVVGGGAVLTSAAVDTSTLGLIPGMWVFVGGDAAGEQFANNAPFYARVSAVDGTAKTITFDKTTVAIVTDAGATKTIQMFWGDYIRNEPDPDNIIRFSSTIERTLGSDGSGIQTEYITGAVANELKLTSPLSNLLHVDLSYVGQRAGTRTGTEGPLSTRASNTRDAALGEAAFNTSSDIYRLRMATLDPATLNPTPFFARVTEWDATVKNNTKAAKAQGVLGGFDTIVGNFDVDLKLTAYFNIVEAIHAIKCNYDVTFDAIYAKDNAGLYMDIPLLAVGGGRLDISQDQAIMIPLESPAAESTFGHTLLIGWFGYLPTVAMPLTDC